MPAKLLVQFVVRKTVPFPLCGSVSAIKPFWKGPTKFRAEFAKSREKISCAVGNRKTQETANMPAIGVKKLTAGQEVVVNDIECFSFDPRLHACQNDGLGAIVNIRHR